MGQIFRAKDTILLIDIVPMEAVHVLEDVLLRENALEAVNDDSGRRQLH
jgi:hypothetical protein